MKLNKIVFVIFLTIISSGLRAQCRIDSLKLLNYPSILDNLFLKEYYDNFCFDKKKNAILLKNIVVHRIKSGKPNSYDIVESAITGYAYAVMQKDKDILTYSKGLNLIDSVTAWYPSFSNDEKLRLLQLKYHLYEQSSINSQSILRQKEYEIGKILLLKEITEKQKLFVLDETYKLMKYYYDYANVLYDNDNVKNKKEALYYLSNIESYNFIWVDNDVYFDKFYKLYEAMALRKIIWLRGDLRALEISKFKITPSIEIVNLHAQYIRELGGEYPPAMWNAKH